LPQHPQPATVDNIHAVARLEKELLEERTALERIGDAIGSFVGTMTFVTLHAVGFLLWILFNLRWIPALPAFDPFPFMLLSLVVSVEGVLLTTFVLMKQNRMSKRAEQRNRLNLQIDLLAEREATTMLQMLTRVCERLGIQEGHEPKVQQLSEETSVDLLARELKERMPD
jgi:uncharacterized membrane protein